MVNITLYQGQVLGINLPETVPVVVERAEEAVRGDTATALQKKA